MGQVLQGPLSLGRLGFLLGSGLDRRNSGGRFLAQEFVNHLPNPEAFVDGPAPAHCPRSKEGWDASLNLALVQLLDHREKVFLCSHIAPHQSLLHKLLDLFEIRLAKGEGFGGFVHGGVEVCISDSWVREICPHKNLVLLGFLARERGASAEVKTRKKK